MARTRTQAAEAAMMIRKHLKKNGISSKVRSKNFSMGSSVDVDLQQVVLPATLKAIEEYCGQFQQGSFDGMQDLYEYTNSRNDLPQAKFVTVHALYTDELQQAVWDKIRSYMAGYEEAPESFQDAGSFNDGSGYGDSMIWRVLSDQWDIGFWTEYKARVRVQG